MNALRINRTNTQRTATGGVLNRLRSTCLKLISPARVIDSMPPAMTAEPNGAVEIVESWRAEGIVERLKVDIDNDIKPGPGHVAPSHAELLLRSACDLLCSQPITLVTATSVSLPREPGITTHHLVTMASIMAAEYGVLADVSVNGDFVKVRLTRRVPRVPSNEKQSAAPISARGPRKGRN